MSAAKCKKCNYETSGNYLAKGLCVPCRDDCVYNKFSYRFGQRDKQLKFLINLRI